LRVALWLVIKIRKEDKHTENNLWRNASTKSL
jgi:hypothetical protein